MSSMITAAAGTILAPWLATAFGIAAAVSAEQTFRFGNKAAPPDRWRGDESYFTDFDHTEEIAERSARDCAREAAAAWQSAATYLAIGAAIEATAASQHDYAAIAILVFGVCLLVPIGIRVATARRNMARSNAWYVSLQWSLARKHVRSQDPAEENAAFAKDHPKEAALLRKSSER